MTTHRVAILGAGAAGVAAARVVAGRDDTEVTIVARTGETPYNRMLIKGVAYGHMTPELVRVQLPDTTLITDTAHTVNIHARRVHLASGAQVPFDSLIVATGSTPRLLSDTVDGAQQAVRLGRATTLHSVADAVRVRNTLHAHDGPGRVIYYGGGVTAAETASALSMDGHHVTLIARSTTPGSRAFGDHVAAVIADDHRARLASTHFGRTVAAVSAHDLGIDVRLDDGTTVTGDLLIVALGTIPATPAPWNGAIAVDDRLRTGVPGVYAAGGVTEHHDDVGTWRIDHWDDGAAQGAHAATMVLSDRGCAPDPGPYRPRSPFMAMVHGKAIAGAGLTTYPATRPAASDKLLVLHEHGDTVIGVSGVDAIASVYQWSPRLHQATA